MPKVKQFLSFFFHTFKWLAIGSTLLSLLIVGSCIALVLVFTEDEYLKGKPLKAAQVSGTDIVLIFTGDQGALGYNGLAVVQRKAGAKSTKDYRVLCETQNREPLDFEVISDNSVKCLKKNLVSQHKIESF